MSCKGMLCCISIFVVLYSSGEIAFKTMTDSLGWAKRPMLQRVGLIAPRVSISFIYGAKSWIDSSSGYWTKALRSSSCVQVFVSTARDARYVEHSQHYLFSTNRGIFVLSITFLFHFELSESGGKSRASGNSWQALSISVQRNNC